MKHSNISIFVPHIGCPHRCSFCDQNTISGAVHIPDGDEVRRICSKALTEVRSPEDTEIAFFGGSFTAVPRSYMLELLEAAAGFVGRGKFRGIRCSTRPDCIGSEVLSLLMEYGVTSIELGAQSMNDEVLEANERGHTSGDVVRACGLIREYGFELGLQMMTGLYKSSLADDMATAKRIADLHPDTVRIYPVVVLNGTRLGELYRSGKYRPAPFEDMVSFCGDLIRLFCDEGINVIKCGLHASEFVEQDMVGGYYHPAFRELCEAELYKGAISQALAGHVISGGDAVIAVHPSCISKAMGHKRSNHEYFRQLGINIKIIGDEAIPVYQCRLR